MLVATPSSGLTLLQCHTNPRREAPLLLLFCRRGNESTDTKCPCLLRILGTHSDTHLWSQHSGCWSQRITWVQESESPSHACVSSLAHVCVRTCICVYVSVHTQFCVLILVPVLRDCSSLFCCRLKTCIEFSM